MKTPSTVSLYCTRAAEPNFMPAQLIVPDDVRLYLSDSHKLFVYSMLGIHV